MHLAKNNRGNLSSAVSFGEQLRRERRLRSLRQCDLADSLGTSVTTIKRWERGNQQPRAYFHTKLSALFGKSTEELGLLDRE